MNTTNKLQQIIHSIRFMLLFHFQLPSIQREQISGYSQNGSEDSAMQEDTPEKEAKVRLSLSGHLGDLIESRVTAARCPNARCWLIVSGCDKLVESKRTINWIMKAQQQKIHHGGRCFACPRMMPAGYKKKGRDGDGWDLVAQHWEEDQCWGDALIQGLLSLFILKSVSKSVQNRYIRWHITYS